MKKWAFHVLLFLAAAMASNAASVAVFDPGVWPRSDAALGIAGFIIEDFEDAALAPGLLIEISDSTDNFGPTNALAASFDPDTDDPNTAKAFKIGLWDGAKLLLNRRTPPPSGYLDFAWGDTTFHLPGGATSFGFSIQNMELAAQLRVNGTNVAALDNLLPLGGGRNGYVRIDAAPGETIRSVTVVNGASGSSGDGLAFDHVAFSPVPVCTTSPSGLAHWYRGEGNSYDAVGTFHGVLQNGTAFAAGKVGQAFHFDGADDYADLGNWFNLQVFTIAMWVKAGAAQQTYADIIDNNHTDGRSWVVQYGNTGLQFHWGVAGIGGIAFNLIPDQWQFLVITMDPATDSRVYLDGVLIGSIPTGRPVTYDGSQFLRLSGWGGGGRHFNGSIDELDIYNRALTDVEVQMLYAASSAGKCRPCAPRPAGLLAWWPAEGNSLDSAGQNHGTLGTAVSFTNGQVGQAFLFVDDPGSFVTLPASSDWMPTNNQLTLECWIKPNFSVLGDKLDTIISKRDGCGTFSYHFGVYRGHQGKVGPLYFGSSAGGADSTSNVPNDGQFHHVAVTLDGSKASENIRFYIDGQPAGVFDRPQQIPLTTDAPVLGRHAGCGYYSSAAMDEISLYHRELAASEIQAIFNAGAAGKCHSCAPIPNGLAAWWQAESNASDSVGGNHGGLQNGATFAPGMVGQAFSLNGANQYVLVGDPVPPSLQIQNEITLSAWIYATAYPGSGTLGLILGSQYDVAQAGATLFLDGRTNPDGQPAPPGHIHFQIGDGSWHTANANAQVPLNQWVHIAATRKANEDAKIYYDGVLQPSTSLPWSGAISYNGAWFAIGQQKDLNRPFNGLIDEPAIYNRALSPAEIQALASAGGAGMCVPANPSDLAITTVLAGSEANAGVPFPVIFTVTNAGPNAATGTWTNTIVLSNSVLNLQPIARLPFNGTLAAGASVTFTQSIIIPATFTGDFALGVLADAANQVPELNEGNNFTFAPLGVHIRAPDLVLDSVATPTSAQLGATIELRWYAHNAGDTAAFANWNDVVYLTTNASTLAGATLLATRPVSDLVPLPAGAAYVRTQSVTLPLNTGTPLGTYFLVFRVDASNAQVESNEGNNEAARFITLTQPPLPDLLVTNVVSGDFALPGGTVTVQWSVTNGGAATVSGAWTEAVLLRNDVVAQPDQLLQTFSVSNTLAPGEFISRTQTVTLPLTNTAGLWRIDVATDFDNTILEESDGNNAAVAMNTLTVPATLRLALPVTRVSESASNIPIRCVIARNAGLESDLLVSLSANPTNQLEFPPTLTIPAGETTIVFDLRPIADNTPDGDKIVTITARGADVLEHSAVIRVFDVDLPRLELALADSSMVEGSAMSATVSREPVTTNDLVVLLVPSSRPRVLVPSSVTIPANQASVMFAIAAVDNSFLESTQRVSLIATAAGFIESSADFSIIDNDAPSLSLTLAAATISEGAGGIATEAMLSRASASEQALVFALSSSNTNAAVTPGTVTIPANATSVSFPIGAVDDSTVDGTQTATILARVSAPLSGAPLGPGAQAGIDVTDDDGPTLTVIVARSVVPEGMNAATAITVSRNTATTSALQVTLASTDTTEATVPVTMMIPAGQSSASADVASLADGAVDGNQPVTITASAAGFTSGSARLVVSDSDLPDLVISQITAPASAFNDSTINISFQLANTGVAPFTGTALQRVLISGDPFLGNDIVPGNFEFTGTLAVSEQTNRTAQVRLPQAPGDYWLIVIADATGLVSEGLEDNNARVAAMPVQVRAAYTATVQTDIEVAPGGTDVPLRGEATSALGGAAALVPVSIYVDVRGTRRTLTATTDANGQFTTTFRPLPGEAGHYEISAANPGVTEVAPQDEFTLLGMRVDPERTAHTLSALSAVSNQVQLVNLSDMPISGVTATVVGAPPSLSVQVSVAGALPGSASIPLTYTVESLADAGLAGTLIIRLTSAQGATVDLPVNVTVRALFPRLVVRPARLSAGMVRGEQTLIEFDVTNEGGTDSGPVNVLTPELPWLHVASTLPLPSLAPGQSNRVTLQLMPAADFPLTEQQGTMLVSATGAQTALPFSFLAISSARGDLRIEAIDEYTFYAQGAPKIAGAAVTVRDAITTEVVTNGVTDTNGVLLLPDLREAYYVVEVSADRHTPFRRTLLVGAGQQNEVRAFLSRQTVQYIWTVVPTEIQDRTRITIETVFETVVPIPVITVEPAVIDLADIQGDIGQIDLKISNHGLIAANAMRLRFDSHPLWEIRPLVTNLGAVQAQSTVTVPLLVRRLGPGPAGAAATALRLKEDGGGPTPCTISGGAAWSLQCGEQENNYSADVTAVNADPACLGTPGGTGGTPGGTTGGGGGGGFGDSASSGGSGGVVAFFPADPPILEQPSSCEECDEENFEPEDILTVNLSGLFSVIKGPLEAAITAQGGGLVHPDITIEAEGGIRTCCNMGSEGIELFGTATAGLELGIGPLLEKSVSASVTIPGPPSVSASISGSVKGGVEVSGGISLSATVSSGCGDGPEISGSATISLGFFAGLTGDASATLQGGENSGTVQALSLNASLNGHVELTATFADGQVTTSITSDGIYYTGTASILGQTFNLFGAERVYLVEPYQSGAAQVYITREIERALVEEFKRQQWERLKQSRKTQARRLQRSLATTSGPLPAAAAVAPAVPAAAEQGICARVRLRLDQDLVMTRSAFNATLELINNDPNIPLEDISVEVNVLDASGRIVNDRFGLRAPQLAGLSAVDGTGFLPANSSGRSSWIIIPNSDAAPEGPTEYSVGGLLTYSQNGRQIVVPLLPVPITVFPDAKLRIKYFHQRDVFSDDPFTAIIEPAEPFALGVLIHNAGKGEAKNVTISSAQPKIIENEKGLLIDFKIVATQVGSNAAQPSLTANFGNIAAGQIGIAQWLLQSSLHGQFIDYNASFQHIDSLGDPKLSLVESVEIHEMIRAVQAGGEFEDGLPDFLVNDVPNGENLPDTLYLSDGRILPAELATGANHDGAPTPGDLQVQLTATMPAGWTYLRTPDPANGSYRLVRVMRSDGIEISLGVNAWVTDRTFIENSRRPINEFNFHLLDYDSTGSYTLFYEVIPSGADTTPPVSLVTPLNEFSTAQFAVSWSGRDELGGSGVASFDVFVSENEGAFTPWLRESRVTSGIYTGVPGNRYSFYSVATDVAGNREPAHTTPDAHTLVTGNTAPSLTEIAPINIDEGQTLSLTVPAFDNDSPTLTFSLSPGAPAGMLINPASGAITWITGEAHGPGTYPVTVEVSDNGVPNLTAARSFTVTVREVNNAPALPALPSGFTIIEGNLLSIDARANDGDLPVNSLQYSLGAGAPAGAAISANGLFSWTPSDAQGGTTNLITVNVADNATPPLSDSRTFLVVVSDVNSAPVLAPISDQLLYEGSTLVLTGAVTDIDLPANQITFDLDPGAPSGATIDSQTGMLAWTPAVAQTPSTNTITIRATDDGVPSESGATTFRVFVVELEFGLNLPRFPGDGSFAFTFKGQAGSNYLLQASSDLVAWETIRTFNATNRIMPLSDLAAPNFPWRFYRTVP